MNILTDDSNHLLDIAISYAEDNETVYHWTICNYPDEVFSYSDSFWNAVILYAEKQGNADIIHFCSSSEMSMRSSASADLREELRTYLETDEYSGKLKHSEIYQGVTFKVYERLQLSTTFVRSEYWATSAPVEISVFITKILGLVKTNALVSAICKAYGIILETGAKLPAEGEINIYTGCGIYSRYTTKSGGNYPYNTTYKYVSYTGYEDANDNDSRAYIDSSSEVVEYDKSESYYNNYSLQVQDAYQTYKILG